MAMLGRKEQPTPTASTSQSRTTSRTSTNGTGGGSEGRMGKLQGRIDSIIAELRKVTWPTREETRNLTIVVVGISAVVGGFLALLDLLLSYIYNTLNGITF